MACIRRCNEDLRKVKKIKKQSLGCFFFFSSKRQIAVNAFVLIIHRQFLGRRIARITIFREAGKEPITFIATDFIRIIASVALAGLRFAGSSDSAAAV